MNERIKDIHHLIGHTMQTTDSILIEKFMGIAKTFMEAPLQKSDPKSILYWEKRWKKYIKPENLSNFNCIVQGFPKEKLQIFRIINEFIGTRTDTMMIARPSEFKNVERQSRALISEKDLVSDLISLLQGGTGIYIQIMPEKIKIVKNLTPPHRIVASKILRAVLCLNLIQDTIPELKGVVGQAISSVLLKEKRDFILKMSTSLSREASILSIFSIANSQLYERISAAAVICGMIDIDDAINSLSYTQKHGNPLIRSMGLEMINAGIDVLTDIIKEWVVYGHLSDQYGEFFIAKRKGKVEKHDWWESKYIVIPERIPSFLVDDKTISRIVSSGRAWNFIKKYKPQQSNLNIESQWSGKLFTLSMVENCAKEAMKNMMTIVMKYKWFPGHLKTFNDFVLFFRGDFSFELFRIMNNDNSIEVLNILSTGLERVTTGVIYTNPITGERLIDRLDMQMKGIVDTSSMAITYEIDRPLDIIFDPDSMVKYRRLSQFLWKLKCSEFQLTANWKRSRNSYIFSVITEDEGLMKVRSILAHTLLITVRTLNEFFSTDILLNSSEKLMSKIKNINDFDEIIKAHQLHLQNLMKSTFLTQDFLDHQQALKLILDTVDRFNDIDDTIDTLFDNIIEDIENGVTLQVDANTFMAKMRIDFSDAKEQLYDIQNEFLERFNNLYELTTLPNSSLELQRLELRLRFCVPRMKPHEAHSYDSYSVANTSTSSFY